MAVGSEGTTSEARTSLSKEGNAAIAMAAVGRAASAAGTAAGAELVFAGVGGGGPAGRTVRREPAAALPLGTGLLTGLGGGGPAGALSWALLCPLRLSSDGDVVSEEVFFTAAAVALALAFPALFGLPLRDLPLLESLGGMNAGRH